jgi:hypothetical protein
MSAQERLGHRKMVLLKISTTFQLLGIKSEAIIVSRKKRVIDILSKFPD